MKSNFRYLYMTFLAIALVFFNNACEDDDAPGTPRVDYVRITSPDSSDSLVVSGGQGQLIAIMGENLGGAVSIEFNNIEASLSMPYITSTSILVRIPTEIPQDINNQFVIYFKDGYELAYDFMVTINEPVLNSMDCEYVNDGGIAVIRGNYFYEPVTVIFPGELEGEVISVEENIIKVRVPEGSSPGQLLVKSNFGTGSSNFMFRDNRNIVVSSDPFVGWGGSQWVVSNPGEGDPELINGNYTRVVSNIGSWAWTEVAMGDAASMGEQGKNIPDEAILHPELYSFKFELNTMKPYNSNNLLINFGLKAANYNAYFWSPPYDTEGQWETVIIPYKELVDAYVAGGSTMEVSEDGYYCMVVFLGNGTLDCDMAFDNFRIVPNKY
nr:glycan-binding surface protein [uncultured Carboxylicivirga sp.]